MDIYRDVQDYRNFVKRFKLTLGVQRRPLQRAPLNDLNDHDLRIQPLPEEAFSIVCYCLMPNHFHFLIRQNADVSISKLINKVFTSYVRYFNKKYDRVGYLLQDRFKAVLIDNDEYLLWLSAYIHQNPKVAGLVKDLRNYRWSSYPEYIGHISQESSLPCDKEIILDQFKSTGDYVNFVNESYEPIKSGKLVDQFDIILD